MNNFLNTFNYSDFVKFKSEWSLCPYEIFLALKFCTYENNFKILEFGSGDGTIQLVSVLKNYNINFVYDSFENDSNYAKDNLVNYHVYDIKKIDDVEILSKQIYDLVIIDGPNGPLRSKWYRKFKNNIRSGTIILIDDFHHFKEFSSCLNEEYDYETILTYNTNASFYEVINEGLEPVDTKKISMPDKSFKVVKIIGLKN